GSGKTEAAKAIMRYLTMLYQRSDPCNVLPILESFGNARTILNDNSSRFGKICCLLMLSGAVVGTSISQYLLEKSRVVFQAHGERNYHVFYELLAGLPAEQKEELYLQEAESYFYLNQGRACDIVGKEDSEDFLVLVQALEGISLSDDQLTSTWTVLAAILQLGNICFTSYEKEFFEHAAIASDTEIQIVANLLRVSADFLQSAVTHRVTVTCYDQIFTPLSVEGAIEARDSIAKTLYYLLFEWLLLRINEWLAPWESDCAVGIVDIHGFEDLGVNSLEQFCINFANERLQHFFSQTVIAQEEEYSQEQLVWIPVSKMYNESCLDVIAAKPHGILCILDDQTSLTQATDHTFLQKCHYHHGNSPWYTKPKLPLPVFTVKHYAGPVTYRVRQWGTWSRWSNRPAWKHAVGVLMDHQQRDLGARGKGLRPRASTLVSKFQESLQDLTAKLRRREVLILSNIFDVEYVTCQLRHSGILEAIHIKKEGYPVRLPFQNFLARYKDILAWDSQATQILDELVFLKEKARQLLERRWNLRQSWAVVTLQRNFRCLLHRRRFRVLQEKVTIIQAHFRGYQARSAAKGQARYRPLPLPRMMIFKVPSNPSRSVILRPLSLAGQYRAQANQITEALPPEVKIKDDLSLPSSINSYPFSSFIKSHFQKTDFPTPGHPLHHPLTHLEAEYQESALEINKLILRFIGDQNLDGWQEVLLGNYIARKGLDNVALRNEIFSQVVTQTWKNPDVEQSQRAWVLMATLLSSFAPSPALEKPLLKFVSDHGMDGFNAVCQRKILTAAKHTDSVFSRAYPPTQLEWTANQRKGKMVLDVHTFNEEKFSAEVESWMTGEQFAGWLLSARGCDKKSRGWSISMFTGNTWQDLLGCDFVLDLIGEMEDVSNPSSPSQSSGGYPITPERDRNFFLNSAMDPLCIGMSGRMHSELSALGCCSGSVGNDCLRVSCVSSTAMVMPQPVMPAVDPNQLAAQQQAFINQQAMLMVNRRISPVLLLAQCLKLLLPIAPAPPLPPPEPKPKKQTPRAKKEPPVVKPSGPASRPEPSREIRNIIKMYQSRPAPEPQRVPKPFMKKNDPKNEALAKLGMMNLNSPRSVSKSPKGAPPPVKPKPGSASSSIKEKQLPLLSIFSQPSSTPPDSQAPLAPPIPPPLPPSLLPGNQEDDGIKTQLYKLTASVSFSYVNPAWKIFLRKEVFYPKENFSHPYCLNLLCEQIMRDTFSDSCLRISREEKRKMKDLLMEFRVGNDVQSIQEDGIKKRIVLAARDNWANYFSRLFPVHGENGSDVQILGVSHRGLRLLKVVKAAGYTPEHLKILCSYSFADVLSVELKGSNALEFSLKTEQLFLRSQKAPCIKAMVETFIQELRQDTNYVVALRSYVTDDKSLLSFKKGDLIQLLPMQGLEPGWQFGSTGGRSGIFPTNLVQLAAAPDYLSTSMDRVGGLRKSMRASSEGRNTSREVSFLWGTARGHAGWSRNCLVPRCPQFFLSHRESVLRGWLLLNLLTGYFLPSKILMPYATKFLQQAGSDPSSTHHGMAVCESCRINVCLLFTKAYGVCLCGVCVPLVLGVVTGRVEQRSAGRLLSQVVELSSLSQHQERQPSTLHKYIGKMVRPMRTEEYLHDYLLEDALVTVSLRRLIWKTPLHFENKIYIDVHYGQVSNKGTVSTRNLSSRGRIRGEASGDVPKGLKKCEEHAMKLPFFGYNFYFVERVSDSTIPVPCYFGVNNEQIVVVDNITQAVSHVIPLKELQKMRTLRPTSDGGLPGIELNYGSAASPKSLWLELFLRAIQKLPSTPQLSLC
uniref:Myosin XVB n=1 Tax=Anser cygnoides TaxID=8845 RepID=A0A8B9DB74_ANSCY